MTELVVEMVSSESKPYLTFGEPDATVMVSWHEGSAEKECGLPSPGIDRGEIEQPVSVKLAGVPCCPARASVMGWVTGTEKVAVMVPGPRMVAVIETLPGEESEIPPRLVDQTLKR